MDAKITHFSEDYYAEMILRFALAAEYKDIDIGTHIVRVSDYSTSIAEALRLSPQESIIIRYASIMHDIGKIGIPDKILHRRKFTEKDFDVVKEHALIGHRIFAGARSPLLQAAAAVALTHHERYDGSGYPNGLKGKDIPLPGRIVALADSFDAIVSKRSYKKARSFSQAVNIIRRESGTHFDPVVVRAFLKNLPKIKQIFKANKTIQKFLKENKQLLTVK